MFGVKLTRLVLVRPLLIDKINKLQVTMNSYSTTPVAELTSEKVEIEGQTINYTQTGKGSNFLLCFPGALGTIWSDFEPQIKNGFDPKLYTTVAWDPPGYGLSRPPHRRFGVDFYERDADTAVKFMKMIGAARFSLLGWSDGGISGMIMAAKYPDVVEKLVIWGANSYIVASEIQAYESIRDIKKWSSRMREPLVKMYGEKLLQEMWSDWCDTMQEIYNKRGGNICKDDLHKIKCPTLILHGDKDPMVLQEHPQHLSKNITNSKNHNFPDGKHNIHLKYAKEFNDIVLQFLKS